MSVPGTRGAFVLAAYAFTVTMLGTTLPTPLYPIYAQELGFGSLTVTVVYATYAVGVLVALLLLGQLSDRVGRRRLLLPGLAVSAASSLVFLLPAALPALLTGRFLSGLSAGIFTGTATAAVVELAPPGGEGGAALVATAANMGGLGCGPLLAGLLAQYAPVPLRLPYVVHLALLVPAGVGVARMPETVRVRGPARMRLARLRMPREVRGTFASAAIAGFAGFATLGLFTSVAPSFLAEVLGHRERALAGLVVFAVFAASTAGQLLPGRIGARRALPAGCLVLVAGMGLIVAALLGESLALLVAGALVAGIGQGAGFRAGIEAVTGQSPPERRGEVTSTLFVTLYVGISIPVVGVGALAKLLGLRPAAVVFAAFVAALSLVAAARLAPRRSAS